MTLVEKLQLRPGMRLASVDAPDGAPAIEVPEAAAGDAEAVLLWTVDSAALAQRMPLVRDAAARGALTWLAYPKGGALGTDLNRDRVREALAGHGLEPVRQIAVDETWSALRFRRSPLA